MEWILPKSTIAFAELFMISLILILIFFKGGEFVETFCFC